MEHKINTICDLIDVKGNKTQWLNDYKKSISNCSKERLIEIAAEWASEAEFQQQQMLKLTNRYFSEAGGISHLPKLLASRKTDLLYWADEYENHFKNRVIADILRAAHKRAITQRAEKNSAKAKKLIAIKKEEAYKCWLNLDPKLSGKKAAAILVKEIDLEERTLEKYVTKDFKLRKTDRHTVT